MDKVAGIVVGIAVEVGAEQEELDNKVAEEDNRVVGIAEGVVVGIAGIAEEVHQTGAAEAADMLAL